MDSTSDGRCELNKPTTEAFQARSLLKRAEMTCSLLVFIIAMPGCGGGSPVVTPAPIPAPAITQQPANQSVPMGLSGTYMVVATGESLQYQWSRNGVAISGATSNEYMTPATI